jgi:hypothetical protein
MDGMGRTIEGDRLGRATSVFRRRCCGEGHFKEEHNVKLAGRFLVMVAIVLFGFGVAASASTSVKKSVDIQCLIRVTIPI